MFKNKFGLMVLFALLVMALTACGDNTATPAPANNIANTTVAANTTSAPSSSDSGIPTLSGASSIPLPDLLKQQSSAYTAALKNATFAAYKSGDPTSKVEPALTDTFKKAGWDDKSSSNAAAASALKGQGIFMLTFQKGTQIVTIIGYPGSLATTFGASVGANETFYLVASGGI